MGQNTFNQSAPLLLSNEEVSQSQKNDDNIGPVYVAVKMKERPKTKQISSWKKKARNLLRYWDNLFIDEHGVLKKKNSKNHQIVLPGCYKSMVFEELHDKMGHLSYDRVTELAKQRFYWSGLDDDFKHYVTKK